MTYSDHFQLADNYLNHIDSVIGAIADPFLQSRYSGFLAVSAVTVYELAIKTIFMNFAVGKHKVLASFASEYFDRINGRIKIDVLKKDYVKKFGEKYVTKFDRKLDAKESELLRAEHTSLKTCYGNIVTWRHSFVHEGIVPVHATYDEVKKSYHYGKNVIHCLAEAMRR